MTDFDALDANFVPTFFSNGGGDPAPPDPTCTHNPSGVEYLVACVSAMDFRGKLSSKGWDPAKYDMCIVDRPEHAQSLIYLYTCHASATSYSVLVHMVNKFADWGVP